MQNQNINDMYMWTPHSEPTIHQQNEDDVELFQSLSSFTPAVSPYDNQVQYYPQDQDFLPLIAPLVASNDLSDAVSRMQMEDYQPMNHQQRDSIASTLSVEIKPCISITEPTPVNRNMASGVSLDFIDNFVHQHSTEMNPVPIPSPLQQQQQEQQQQQQSFSEIMDPNTFLDDLLMAQPNSNIDWLSWTPARGSPVSIGSQSFDDQNSIYSNSSEHSSLYYNLMMSAEELLDSTSMGYPSPSLSTYNSSGSDNNNTLSVKKNRARRVSEPPKLSNSFQEQFLFNPQQQHQQHHQQHHHKQQQQVRRSHSDTNKRRGRSNSSASATGSHFCPHPGCGKSFTRPYNLTSHMRTHTADRPFACSQCGRKFARQHDRNRHEKLHWGVKPYACKHCNKPFARMDALNRHLRVENGCQQQHQQQQQQQQMA